MTGCAGRSRRMLLAGVVTAASVAALVAGPGRPGPAGAMQRGADPTVWTERVCRKLVDVQAGGLDARDALWAAARGAAPADKRARTTAVAGLRAALRPVRADLAAFDRQLARPAPTGARGETVRDALRSGYASVTEAYADAAAGLGDLREVAPARVPAATGKVLTRLDRALDAAGTPVRRLEPALAKSSVRAPLSEVAVCRSIGPDWSFVLEADEDRTPKPPVGADTAPGAVDLTAPSLLLPGRYRPPADVAALAAQTSMTGRSRTYFYGGTPLIETGAPFVVDCPAADAENSQILGCYHDGRIYVLAVTRPEVAQIVPVAAAHEMLHAVYDAAAPSERAEVDALLADFYATTTDARLQRIVAQYDQRAPQNRATELHSLVPTQVPTLTPALDAYYADWFHDRTPVLAAYDTYITLFEGLIARYEDLETRIEDLRSQVTALRSQSDAAGAQANSLATQIDSLRAQGRIAESNNLVGAQNDAVRRAQSLNGQANALIEQHNALITEINEVASQLGGLESSLRPLG